MKIRLLIAAFLLCAFGASAQITAQSVSFFQPPIEGSDFNAGYATTQDSQNSEGGSPVEFFGGTAPYTCSITSGSLPTGMSLKTVVPTGGYPSVICPIYGTPSVSGDFTITFKVTDTNSNTASQSVTFPVMDNTTARTNCTPSGLAAGSVTASSAVITWTTTNACSSQVWYGPDNILYHTSVTDTSGVTSHSVTLTGLDSSSSGSCPAPSGCGTVYVAVCSRGIVAGSPADYLQECSGVITSVLFTTTAGASAGVASFNVDLRGPHNIYQSASSPGYPLIVQIYQTCQSGCSDYSGGVKFQVTGLPPYTQVHWPYTQDWGFTGGYSGCVVSTTTTTNDTCKFSPEGTFPATQFEILTNVGGTTPTGSYTLTLTSTAGTTPTVVTTNWALNVNALPTFTISHPSSQPAVPGFSTWVTNLETYGPYWYVTYNSGGCTVPSVGPGFYDGTKVATFGGQYDTAHASTWATAASNCEAGYYSYAGSSWNVQAIYVLPAGLFYRSVVLNDAIATTGVQKLQTCCGANYFNSVVSFIEPYADADYARESAFMLEAKRLNHDNGGTTSLAALQQLETIVLGNVDQYASDDANTLQESFMAGLMCQSLLEYEMDPNAGNMQDAARVYGACKGLWDHMMANWWVPWAGTNGGFVYETHATEAALNLIFSQGVSGNLTLEDLNPLVSPIAAWINAETHNSTYQQEGDTVEYDGIVEPVAVGVDYFGKTLTQDYRWSFSYMRWRGEANMPCTELGGSTSAGSGTAQNCSLDPLTPVTGLPNAPSKQFFMVAKNSQLLEAKHGH
jgi:hypothetical protein